MSIYMSSRLSVVCMAEPAIIWTREFIKQMYAKIKHTSIANQATSHLAQNFQYVE